MKIFKVYVMDGICSGRFVGEFYSQSPALAFAKNQQSHIVVTENDSHNSFGATIIFEKR